MANRNDLDRGKVIRFMREALRDKCVREKNPNRPITASYGDLVNETLRLLIKAGQLAPPRPGQEDSINLFNDVAAIDQNKPLVTMLTESYTYLLVQGIIIPRPASPNYGSYDSWNNYQLTAFGKEWSCNDTEPIPEDIDGTIGYLRSAIPALDDVVLQYISEALRAFDRRLAFASAVMLGAASEKLFYLLAEAVANAIQNPAAQKELVKLFNDTRILSRLREKIKDTLEDNISNGKIPYAVHKDSLNSILSLFTAIRIQRNDAVHPAAGAVDSAQLRLLLLSFPHICRKIYDLVDWLRMNQL
jgi:hypothetical protein